MRLNDKDILSAEDYFLATVQQVIIRDVVQNERVILQKYSIRRSVRTVANMITRRYFGSTKFVQLPKVGQLVYVWKNDSDYYWTRRFDASQKHNMGFQSRLGSTIVSGTNHDAIIFNGVDDQSLIQISSSSTKNDNKRASIQIFGQRGKITFLCSDDIVSGANRQLISGGQTVVVYRGKKMNVVSDGDMNVISKNGVVVKDSKDRRTQPMVLGQKLSDWRKGLMDDISNFLSSYDRAVAAGFAARGPAQGAGSVPYKSLASAALGTLLINSKSAINNKTFLSSKNKVS